MLSEDQQHLLVSLQLLDEGAFVEQRLQPLLGVVVAELLKRGAPLLLSQPRVLETRSVHDQQGAQGVLAGLQSPEKQEYVVSADGLAAGQFIFNEEMDIGRANCELTGIVCGSVCCLLWSQFMVCLWSAFPRQQRGTNKQTATVRAANINSTADRPPNVLLSVVIRRTAD